jgi:hypothetical protein
MFEVLKRSDSIWYWVPFGRLPLLTGTGLLYGRTIKARGKKTYIHGIF